MQPFEFKLTPQEETVINTICSRLKLEIQMRPDYRAVYGQLASRILAEISGDGDTSRTRLVDKLYWRHVMPFFLHLEQPQSRYMQLMVHKRIMPEFEFTIVAAHQKAVAQKQDA